MFLETPSLWEYWTIIILPMKNIMFLYEYHFHQDVVTWENKYRNSWYDQYSFIRLLYKDK